MINLGEKIIVKNKINIVDDINTQNKKELFTLFDKADYVIDKKLPMPTPDLLENNSYNSSYDKIVELAKVSCKLQFTNDSMMANFITKINYWCSQYEKLFNGDMSSKVVVFNYDLTKHEWYFACLLGMSGATVVVVSTKVFEYNKPSCAEEYIVTHKYGTSEKIVYDTENSGCTDKVTGSRINLVITTVKDKQVDYIQKKFKNLEEVEQAIFDNHEPIKLIVNGVEEGSNTRDFYGRIYLSSLKDPQNKLLIVKDAGLHTEDFNRFIKLNDAKHTVALEMSIAWLKNISDEIKTSIRNVFRTDSMLEMTNTIYNNKLAYCIITLSKLFKDGQPKYVFIYGERTPSAEILLWILNGVKNLGVVVLTSNRDKEFFAKDMQVLDLPCSSEYFDIPKFDYRTSASTMAYRAQQRVEETFYKDNTLGMYKPGQFKRCNVVSFKCTCDEVKLWWNKEVYLRPGFSAQGDTATIPAIFKIIKGVKEGCSINQYVSNIGEYTGGKSILLTEFINWSKSIYEFDTATRIGETGQVWVQHSVDINGTLFKERKPFYAKGKLLKENIKTDKNYKYGMLDDAKQDFILDKIEEIINGNYIKPEFKRDKDSFIDEVLNVCLNLSTAVVRDIQWFEFYTYNPNLIVITGTDKQPQLQHAIITLLLHLLGFDVLIYVSTCYNSVEKFYTDYVGYDVNLVGEAVYDVDFRTKEFSTGSLTVGDTNKPKGFFAKLFGM